MVCNRDIVYAIQPNHLTLWWMYKLHWNLFTIKDVNEGNIPPSSYNRIGFCTAVEYSELSATRKGSIVPHSGTHSAENSTFQHLKPHILVQRGRPSHSATLGKYPAVGVCIRAASQRKHYNGLQWMKSSSCWLPITASDCDICWALRHGIRVQIYIYIYIYYYYYYFIHLGAP